MYALHWYANQHIRMISEGSRGTKDWSDDAENKECDPLSENPAKVFFFVICCFLQKIIRHMVKNILWKCNLYIFNIDWVRCQRFKL